MWASKDGQGPSGPHKIFWVLGHERSRGPEGDAWTHGGGGGGFGKNFQIFTPGISFPGSGSVLLSFLCVIPSDPHDYTRGPVFSVKITSLTEGK